MLKSVRDKADKTWTWFKKVLTALSVWGLLFSLVTIGNLRVAFDYDDTLVFSTPAFAKAFRSGAQPFTPGFWETVNANYDIEKKKLLPYSMALGLRALGFKITVLTSRPAYGGDALRKEWRHLVSQFLFITPAQKQAQLQGGHYVLYVGDSDGDVVAARAAGVPALRVRRSPKSSYKEDYHPGSLREWVIPFSEY